MFFEQSIGSVTDLAVLQFTLLTILALVVARGDIKCRAIPNLAVVVGIVAGLFIAASFKGLQGLGESSFGLLAGVFTGMPGYLLGKTGAGSVKVSAAIGAIGGGICAVSSLVAGSIASIIWSCRSGKRTSSPVFQHIALLTIDPGLVAVHLPSEDGRLPLGSAIAVVAPIVYLSIALLGSLHVLAL